MDFFSVDCKARAQITRGGGGGGNSREVGECRTEMRAVFQSIFSLAL